jgi:hypothetical protein
LGCGDISRSWRFDKYSSSRSCLTHIILIISISISIRIILIISISISIRIIIIISISISIIVLIIISIITITLTTLIGNGIIHIITALQCAVPQCLWGAQAVEGGHHSHDTSG